MCFTMNKRRFIPGFLLLILFLIIFSGCNEESSYYLVGSKEEKKELRNLISIMNDENTKSESKFIIIQQISKILHASARSALLNLFLTTYVERHPEDPFNAYYLFLVAKNYMEDEAFPIAVHYYERILKNYPDLLVRGKSIHYLCLNDLIKLTDEPELRVTYYKELISRYGEEIDKGSTYYWLAKTYEKLGEWELSIQAYNNFLNYPKTQIPGEPDAWKEVKSMVDFYNYDGKEWTMESLDELVSRIRYSIHSRNIQQLKRYKAKVNFFTMSWEQGESFKSEDEFIANLGQFLGSQVWCLPDLDNDSNDQEAYLKTTGWSYRIKTWYLYFRKIYFPPDPDKHGQWEWAGIYFGEKPFAGAQKS